MKRLLYVYLLFLTYSLLATGASDTNGEHFMYNEALKAYEEKNYEEVEKLLNDKSVDEPDSLNLMKLNLAANNSFRLSDYSLNNNDPEKALNAIEKSIGFYKRILQVEKKNANVSHNLELAMKKRDEIRSRKKEDQNQEKQSQSDQNQLDEIQKKQENLASDSQKGAEDHKSRQEKIKNETAELKNKTASAEENFKEKMNQAQTAQEKAMEAIDKKNFTEAGEYQKEASQYLKEASDILGGNKNEQGEQSQEQENSVNESDQIAKSIIDNENDRESTSEATGDGIFVDRNW